MRNVVLTSVYAIVDRRACVYFRYVFGIFNAHYMILLSSKYSKSTVRGSCGFCWQHAAYCFVQIHTQKSTKILTDESKKESCLKCCQENFETNSNSFDSTTIWTALVPGYPNSVVLKAISFVIILKDESF